MKQNFPGTRIIGIGFIFLTCIGTALSQGGAATSQMKDTGNKADQNLKSVARINSSTLAMEMSVPLANYPGRSGNSLPIGISYSSKLWNMRPMGTYFYTTPIGHYRQYVTWLGPKYAERTAAGWTTSLAFPVIEEELQLYTQTGEPFDDGLDFPEFNSLISDIFQPLPPTSQLVIGPPTTCGWNCHYTCPNPWLSEDCVCHPGNEYLVTTGCPIPGGSGSCGTWCDIEPQIPPNEPPPTRNYIKRVHIRFGNGSTVEFRKSDAVFGYCIGQNGDGGNCEGSTGYVDNLGKYLAVDGSGLTLERTASGSTLTMPDGGRYVFPSASTGSFHRSALYQSTDYIDVNGNHSQYINDNVNNVRTAKDTLGRTITDFLPENLHRQDQIEGTQEVDMPGLSGQISQNFQFKWLHLKPVEGGIQEGALENPAESNLFYGNVICTGAPEPSLNASGSILFPNNGIGLRICNPGSSVADAERFNPIVLAEIQLPNGKKYEFKYNQYGEITKIIYPTGSYETFNYERIAPISGFSSPAYDQTNRGVTERKVYSADDTLQQRWQYSANFDSSTNAYKVTTIAPKGDDPMASGAKSERYLHATHSDHRVFGFENPLNGMPVEERSFDENGILRSRTINDYIVKGPVPTGDPLRPAYSGVSRDPRLSRSVTITYEPPATGQGATSNLVPPPGGDDDPPPPPCGSCGGGNPSIPGDTLVTLTKTTYDENGNSDISYFSHLKVKQTKSYHFAVVPASTSIGTTPTWATIESWFPESKRAAISETDYLYDANYRDRGISGLPIESRVLDPTNTSNVLAKTQTVYDESGYPIISAGTDGQWVDPQSGLRGNVTTKRLWNKDTNTWIETHAQFDNFGNLRKAWDASGDPTRFTETDYSSTYSYAYPTSVTAPAPDPTNTTGTDQTSTVTTTYDFNTGLPLTVTDDFGQTTATEYDDPLLRPTRTFALNFAAPETQTIYDDTNRTIKGRKQIDETNWDEATTFMDSLGRTVKTQAKDSQGDVFVETHYDNMGRIDRVTNPYRAGDTIYWSKTRYDEAGRAVETYAPAELANLGSAPSLGTSAFDISTVTDFIGAVVTSTDASGRKGRSITNALGQLIRVDEPTATGGSEDADLGTLANPAQPTSYKYDVNGKMVEVTQGVQKRWFKYDSLGRLIRVRQPEQEVNTSLNLSDAFNTSGQWTAGFTYDVLGNVITATDAKGTVITNTYDKANRVTTRTYSNEPQGITTPTVSFFYDGKGLDTQQSPNFARGSLTKVTSSVSETQYQLFDNSGRLTQSAQITDGQTYTSKYTYNLSGALIEEEYPSGRKVKNEYESDGDLARIYGTANSSAPERTYANTFSYMPDGRIEKLRLGNGLWERAKFNSRLQVTELSIGHGISSGDLWNLGYEYGELDSNGNVDTAKNTGNVARQTLSFAGLTNPFVQTYKYDSLYRLTEAKETSNGGQTWKENFTYDRYGNRTSHDKFNGTNQLTLDNITNPTIDANTNRFNGNQGYTFDKNGNLTIDPSGGGRSFVFNGDNRQKEIRDASNNLIGEYFYDGEGKRVKKKTYDGGVLDEETVFVYSSGKLIAEYSSKPPAQDPTTSYTITDQLGSPRVLVNTVGQVVSRRDFLPFGEEIIPDSNNLRTNAALKYTTDGVRQKFTGYQKDEESGLDFAEARMYENRHGRFTAIDPLLASGKSANPQTFNRYVYALNNPLLLTDPNGLQAGKWYFPVDENGNRTGRPQYLRNGSDTSGFSEATERNRAGNLVYSAEGMNPDFVVRLNPMGPASVNNPLDLDDMFFNGPYVRNGWDTIRSDASEDSFIEHPADGYVRGSEMAITPLDVALFCTPFKGAAGSSIARSFATEEGGAVFYSGGGRATGEFAQAFATNTGRKTIEMTPGGKVLDSLTNFSVGGKSINNSLPSLSDRIWGFGSRQFAQGASGQTSVILKSPFRTNSTFFRIEQPILQQNPNVFIRQFRIPSCTTRPIP